jgi:hypothetical protein
MRLKVLFDCKYKVMVSRDDMPQSSAYMHKFLGGTLSFHHKMEDAGTSKTLVYRTTWHMSQRTVILRTMIEVCTVMNVKITVCGKPCHTVWYIHTHTHTYAHTHTQQMFQRSMLHDMEAAHFSVILVPFYQTT